jgi:hypothetical protein
MEKYLREKHSEGVYGDAFFFSGSWYKYKDNAGLGYCQTDFELHLDEYIIVLECKLTQTNKAKLQLLYLYKPILEWFFEKEIILVQVCRTMKTEPDWRLRNLRDLVTRPRNRYWTWHKRI